MEQQVENKRKFGLNALVLKIIGIFLMSLDHIALLFYSSDTVIYEVFRSIGKISFPIFAFLAVEGVYHTRSIKNYLLRLGVLAVLMDVFGYIIGAITNISVASNPLIGNVFTDLFLGVLLVYLLKRKDKFSFLAILPATLAVLSDVTISDTFGTLIKADWGTFSIVLFLFYFLARFCIDTYIKNKYMDENLSAELLEQNKFKYYKIASAIALVIVELLFNLLWHIDYTSIFLPNEFIPIGTYSTLAFIFILLYNGERGFSSKNLQYCFYLYYPLHLVILGIISLYFGTLAYYL